ncbi:MAG: hypothetical protein GY810_30385 [Aureispira sp.]|nr:hypothetical protein [Aureispira sp.]
MITVLKNTSIFAIVLLLAVSCMPHINYLGKSYPAQDNNKEIDLFFDEKDISKDFEVMGIMKSDPVEDIDMDDPQTTQEQMVKEARKRGGDAILFMGTYQEKVSSANTSSSTSTYEDGETITSTSTTVNTVKVMEAKLLKYK